MALRHVLLATVAAASWAPPDLKRHLSCPFAHIWLEHGPDKASDILGMPAHKAPSDEPAPPRCSLASGFAGGGHQHSHSPGYSTNCSGAPGALSPYMWPINMSFKSTETTLPYDTNTPTLVKKTEKWYNFDKMLKRSDSIEGIPKADNDLTTVLHRNSMMWILYWKEGADFVNVSQIKYCMNIDMGEVGLIRPDFFLDSRPYGEMNKNISTQYLGVQHMYHMGEPRLVRQWRKSDFVNTVFTVSLEEHVGDDGVHWPLMMDVPGETSGPDVVQNWHDHRFLTEDDEKKFFIEQDYIAAGGKCHDPFNQQAYVCDVCLHKYDQLVDGGGAEFEDLPADWLCPVCGAPKSAYKLQDGQWWTDELAAMGNIPSALEKEEASWREIEYTFSPIWKPPVPGPPAPSPVVLQYQCDICHHVYDPDADGAGLPFDELPDDWVCPVCSVPKSHYKPDGGSWAV